ncbi:MAG: TolC family protein, partial [Pseudomonadales bacterium]|nr:TolC family protein [Pseudomonadales bacterium]
SVPREVETSGKRNLTYILHERSFLKDIQLYRDIKPFKKLGLVGDSSLTQIKSFNQLFSAAKARVLQEGIEMVFIPIDTNIQSAIEAIENALTSEDAIYLLPTERLTNTHIQYLGKAMIKRMIAAFAMQDNRVVKQGFLAVYNHENTHKRERRRIALNIRDILNGDPAESLNVYLEIDHQLFVNQDTANELGIGLKWSTLQKAEIISVSTESQGTQWTMPLVAQEAVKQNLSLMAERKAFEANASDVEIAKAKRLPQLSIDVQQTLIDEDRARFSNGNSAERDLSASLTLQQLLYSEAAYSNISVQKKLQNARQKDLLATELDIISDASQAYLNLLRAQSLVEVEKSNLELTKANLKRAERRVSAGAARKSEIFRWQSQVSENQRSLLDAEARLQNARLQLNQLLNRPLTEEVATEVITKDHAIFDFNRRVTERYVTGPKALQNFANKSERFGAKRSPELESLKLTIKAQERLLKANQRQYYLPDVSLQASLKEHVDENGEGDNFPPGVDINDTDGSVAIVLSLPLYSGGERSAEVKQTTNLIHQLNFQLTNTERQIRQRIRTAVNQMSASYPGIELSENALKAAQQNYAIVRDSYERGTVSIVDFLDAQNQAFGASVSATNAVYDYLEDQIEYQRSIAYFFDLEDPTAIKNIMQE